MARNSSIESKPFQVIYGERDAVLADTFLTTKQSQTLVDWVVASGKNLTAIYVTHGHGDHFFGLAPLLERFPRARAVATPEVVQAMHEHLSPTWIENFWRRLFPGEIPDRLLVAEPLEHDDLELEGHKLVAVNTGRRLPRSQAPRRSMSPCRGGQPRARRRRSAAAFPRGSAPMR
jgi:glyoxylase-like metal-dependent hydrolase (beta-lactamase superfamily II)